MIAASAVLAASGLRANVSYDAFWHLRMGQDLVANGMPPWLDHYSFTFPGGQILTPPFPFQALLYLIVAAFGVDQGFVVYQMGSLLLLLALFCVWLRQVGANAAVVCLTVPALVLVLQLRTAVRPELLDYAFLLGAMMLAHRAGHTYTFRTMAPLALLMLAWTNFHAPIFGFIVLFGFFTDAAGTLWRERAAFRDWCAWAGWGALIAATGFLNVSLEHTALSLLQFDPAWKALIQEYQFPALYAGISGLYVVAALALLTLVLLVRQRRFGAGVVWLLMVANALDTARIVTPASIVVLCLLAESLARELRGPRAQAAGRATGVALGAAIAVAAAVPLASSVRLAQAFVTEDEAARELFPVAIVDYMLDEKLTGNVFNAYETGGYLIYRGAPDLKVYIDGRAGIHYSLDHYRTYREARMSAALMRDQIERYGIDFALLRREPNVAAVQHATGEMVLDFMDSRYLLFRAGRGNFPRLGTLLARPACWDQGWRDALRTEQSLAAARLPPGALLPALGRLAYDYATAADKAGFLRELPLTQSWPDPMLRFVGYRALELGQNARAAGAFRAVRGREPKDFLAEALALERAGETALAAQAVGVALRAEWPYLEPGDVRLMAALLERHADLGVPASTLAALRRSAGADLGDLPGHIAVSEFCRGHD